MSVEKKPVKASLIEGIALETVEAVLRGDILSVEIVHKDPHYDFATVRVTDVKKNEVLYVGCNT